MELEGQPSGTWFTAFECDTLSSDSKDWIARSDSVRASAADLAAGAVPLSVDTDKPSKFVKIVASDHKITSGTKLSDIGL